MSEVSNGIAHNAPNSFFVRTRIGYKGLVTVAKGLGYWLVTAGPESQVLLPLSGWLVGGGRQEAHPLPMAARR